MFNLFRRKLRITVDPQTEKARTQEEKELRKKKKEENILSIMEKSGWSREETIARVEDARQRLGMTYHDFNKYDFHKIPAAEQEAFYAPILEHKALRKQRKEENILSIMKKTGWSREETIAQVEDAKKRVGITYRDYNRYDFYKVPAAKQEAEYETVVKKAEKKKRKAEKNEKFIHTVMEKTGWDYDTAKKNMKASKKLCGAEYKDYVAYEFWNTEPEVQKTYFTKGDANALRKKYNTNPDNIDCFRNKNQFNEVFRECLGRVWSYNRDLSFEAFSETFGQEKKIMYKPLSASCGSGVRVFDLEKDGLEQAYQAVTALPMGILEGYLIQHPEMSRFSRRAVNTIRIVSVFDGETVHILYAAFRMAGGDAVVDNFHHGGVLALIDLETGAVMTDAIDLKGNIYETHPATGEKIKGFAVPYWTEAKDLIDKAARIVDGIGYVGWDVAITESGPVLIEGNTSPAPNVLQLPFYLQERKGMHYVVEPLL